MEFRPVKPARLKFLLRICAAALVCSACAITVGLRAASDPGAELKAGISAFEGKRYPAAITTLEHLGSRIPKLADYTGWYLASSYSESKNFAQVPAALEPVWQQNPPSPFRAKAAMLSAYAYLENSLPKAAVDILRAHYSELPQPQGDMAMADAASAAGETITAAVYYQRVYYGFPQSPLSERAHQQDMLLRDSLANDYPPSMPSAMLARASKLADNKQVPAAIKEFDAMIPLLGGAERDEARVRIGVARYTANENVAAYEYLSDLEVTTPEADAERMHYLVQSARRLDKLAEMEKIALQSAKQYPSSPWTIDSLIAAANRHLMDHNVDRYLPLYTACYKGLPGDPKTDLCHWKVTWAHYMRRDKDVADMLRDHLRLYPGSDLSPNALYFLGRLAELSGDAGSARAYYQEAATQYPNVFYALQARERLATLKGGPASTSVTAFLNSVSFPERAHARDFKIEVAATARQERSRLLAKAGLRNLAETEIRFGADLGEQPHVLAMELGRLVGAEDPAQAMRYVKRYAKGYLFMPLESAPVAFWQQAFPLPYRDGLERYSKERDLDPFLMAGLIRQESEFDAKVISYANARGLTQIEPTTGREIGKRLKVAFSTPKLFDPDYNLKFGTYYFRQNLDRLNGNVAATLAAYNAGMTRAKAWLKWDDFHETAEFIETVPITQTRDYIQAVLRNAGTYREIYRETPAREKAAE